MYKKANSKNVLLNGEISFKVKFHLTFKRDLYFTVTILCNICIEDYLNVREKDSLLHKT